MSFRHQTITACIENDGGDTKSSIYSETAKVDHSFSTLNCPAAISIQLKGICRPHARNNYGLRTPTLCSTTTTPTHVLACKKTTNGKSHITYLPPVLAWSRTSRRSTYASHVSCGSSQSSVRGVSLSGSWESGWSTTARASSAASKAPFKCFPLFRPNWLFLPRVEVKTKPAQQASDI